MRESALPGLKVPNKVEGGTQKPNGEPHSKEKLQHDTLPYELNRAQIKNGAE